QGMHDCQKFRENLTDIILGGDPIDADIRIINELNSCSDCGVFYREALTVSRIVHSASVDPAEEYWDAFTSRLELNLREQAEQRPARSGIIHWAALSMAGAMSLVVAVWFGIHGWPLSSPAPDKSAASVEFIDAPVKIDPGTVHFLEQ